jgi:DNA-binding NtrC family response regulator
MIDTQHADGANTVAARFALVVDDDQIICRFLARALSSLGMESASRPSAQSAIAALRERRPDIIFLDLNLTQSDAIDVINGLSEERYTGIIQLMSGGRMALLEAVQRVGEHHGLVVWAPLQKPFRLEAIREVVAAANAQLAPPT